MHLTIYLQAMRTSYELATKIYTLHSGRRSLHNQIFPYVVNDEVAETVFSVVIYLLSRELCQTVRQQIFQPSRASSQSKNTFPSSSKCVLDEMEIGATKFNLTSSIKWAHGPLAGAGSESRSNRIFCPSLPSHSVSTAYYFRIREHIFTFHRASWCTFPLTFAIVPGRDCTASGVPAGSGTETRSLRFFDTIGRVDGAVSDSEKDT